MWIVWLARGHRSQPLPRIAGDPFRERDRLAAKANMLATRGEGHVEFHPDSRIEEVAALGPDRGFRVVARVAGELMSWDVERIAACVGHQPDLTLTSELRVSEIGEIRTPEPNYFVLGSKSHGREGDFFLSTGFQQVRTALGQIVGRPDPLAGRSPEQWIQRLGQ
jgi:hypothetical protein